MRQSELNSQEWHNPDNWAGPRWLSVYFSKKDTRALVPKQIPWMGWTLNMGHPRGVYGLIGIILALALCLLAQALLLATNC